MLWIFMCCSFWRVSFKDVLESGTVLWVNMWWELMINSFKNILFLLQCCGNRVSVLALTLIIRKTEKESNPWHFLGILSDRKGLQRLQFLCVMEIMSIKWIRSLSNSSKARRSLSVYLRHSHLEGHQETCLQPKQCYNEEKQVSDHWFRQPWTRLWSLYACKSGRTSTSSCLQPGASSGGTCLPVK